jgi:hypothetical protein
MQKKGVAVSGEAGQLPPKSVAGGRFDCRLQPV